MIGVAVPGETGPQPIAKNDPTARVFYEFGYTARVSFFYVRTGNPISASGTAVEVNIFVVRDQYFASAACFEKC